jgi:hypothetical protein
MSVRYELDHSELKKLEDKFKRIPNNVENIINSYLHKDGAEHTAEAITKFIRVSDPWIPKARHAKTTKWWTIDKENLGFTIKPKESFGYLVFPNEGRGPRNPLEQRFMERGLSKSINDIMDGLNERIDQYLEEEFK